MDALPLDNSQGESIIKKCQESFFHVEIDCK